MIKLKITRDTLLGSNAVIINLAIIKLLIHLATNSQYGFNRDELYYIACGKHLALGYVDHPPLVPFMAKIIGLTLGESLFAFRLLPAFAGAAMVILTGLIVRNLRGGIFAQVTACLCLVVSPLFLNVDMLLTTNVFDQLLWVICFYLIVLILKNENTRYWPLVGLVVGIGLLNKYTMVFFLASLLGGMLLTSARRHFLLTKFWVGILIAILVILPNVVWQVNHGWPTIEFLQKAAVNRMANASPIEFIWQQILSNNPLTFPFSILGLYFFLFSKKGQRYRVIGFIYVIVLVVLAVQRSKDYYLAPTYPVLWAAGGIVMEKYVKKMKSLWLTYLIIGLLVLSGIVVAPLAVPILPLEQADTYGRYFGSGLHPVFADMLGWEQMVARVGEVYNELPAQDKQKCAILANNYGQAAAIDFFGSKYGLPKSICTHNSYWIWGPRDYSGQIIISVGVKRTSLDQAFESVRLAGTITNDNVVWYETNQPIFIWQGPRMSLQQLWPRMKLYY